MSKISLGLHDVKRTFYQGRNELKILNGCNLEIAEGEIVALVGPSGSGKSTLLHIAGLLEAPDSGTVVINDQSCVGLNDDGRTAIRRQHLGFVYQYHHLLPEFSALENISIPQIIGGRDKTESRLRALEMLQWMGLNDRADHRPGRLSGGEQQRVAIARAIVTRPTLLLADEPTGNLDPQTADDVFAVLLSLARGVGLSALIATHNPELARKMDRIVRLENGVLVT